MTHDPLGIACYPVDYLRPPHPPAAIECPLPEQRVPEDPDVLALVASDGSVFAAYIADGRCS